ncbi:tyrosine-type recombinase/integrase (plasmid) [Phyllobacterium sp. A18/5-2]|uniref:tyrosine-type recombinase/integrase n=1 Tax=Phyllobacterium sp. A18/5-2 TaxID=2978392 RepID=UPI0021C8644B|nr:tyrosine-type recombinase/integrase [Phyllobacterium sp. A18/5-2]UXN67257.1 tyrosine-type recombinase/integrase [Phyllobacterium sp. A18/5-2]
MPPDFLGYPYGPLFRLLCAGGQRASEWAGARSDQLDLTRKVFVIPGPKFRSAKIVPLSDLMMEIIVNLPFNTSDKGNDFIFSFNGGTTPMSSISKGKRYLDRLMPKYMQNPAANMDGLSGKGWVIHDVRHTVRLQLSKLRIDPYIAEAVLGRERHDFLSIDVAWLTEAKREALQAWADELRKIVGMHLPERS